MKHYSVSVTVPVKLVYEVVAPDRVAAECAAYEYLLTDIRENNSISVHSPEIVPDSLIKESPSRHITSVRLMQPSEYTSISE